MSPLTPCGGGVYRMYSIQYDKSFTSVKLHAHSHLAPFIGLPHRTGYSVAGFLDTGLVRAATLVVG